MTKDQGISQAGRYPCHWQVMDVSRFLSSRPAAPASESDQDNHSDVDPEDHDFGGRHDATAASAHCRLDGARQHYRDLPEEGASKRLRLPVVDRDLSERYAGVGTTRAALGLQPKPVESDGADSDSVASDNTNPDSFDSDEQHSGRSSYAKAGGAFETQSDSDDERVPDDNTLLQSRLSEFKEAEASQMQMISQRRVEDAARGAAVRKQLEQWQDILDVRIGIQPLLESSQNPNVSVDLEIVQQVANLAGDLISLFGDSVQSPAECRGSLSKMDRWSEARWKASLDLWHSRASLASTTASAKLLNRRAAASKNLRVIDQGPWAQVELAMSDMDRLLARTQTPRVFPDAKHAVFDDTDFYRIIMRESIHSSALANQMSIRQNPQTAAPSKGNGTVQKTAEMKRSSKGRMLRFDVHEKLVGFMVPMSAPADGNSKYWPVDRINAFFASICNNP